MAKRKRKKNRKKGDKKRRIGSESRKSGGSPNMVYVGLVILVVAAGLYLFTGSETAQGTPAIVIDPASHDFGDVSVAGGVVKTSMTIRNTGNGDLVLNDMDTSCGCTSATVTKDGVEGPVFNMKMHGTNPVGWSETIKPGETALLNIYYDPKVHPDLRGPVTRIISLYSNDPRTPVKEIRIHVNQVD